MNNFTIQLMKCFQLYRYFLAIMHAINCLMMPLEILKQIFMYRQSKKHCKSRQITRANILLILEMITIFVSKYIVNPVLVGLTLYGKELLGSEENDYGVRVCIAFSMINTSLLFLASIGRLPFIGCYTNLISKVNMKY